MQEANAFPVLWSQIEPHGSSYSSNVTYASSPSDDFRLESPALISRVRWLGGRSGRPDPAPTGFYIRFYENVYDETLGHDRRADSPQYEQFIPGTAHQAFDTVSGSYYSYDLDLPQPFAANADTLYWLSIQADTCQDPNDPWWGWRKAASQNLNPAEYNDPTYSHHPINEDPFSDYDLAFELQGQVVPEPATLSTLAAGILALALRIKRR